MTGRENLLPQIRGATGETLVTGSSSLRRRALRSPLLSRADIRSRLALAPKRYARGRLEKQ